MLESRNNLSPISGEAEIIKTRHGTWRIYDATDGLPGQPGCLLQDRDGGQMQGSAVMMDWSSSLIPPKMV